MSAVYKKELRSYFNNFLGYLFVGVMLLIFGFFTVSYNLMYRYTVFEYVYGSSLFIYLITIPILTMRMMAEERRQRTDQLLYSLPLKMSSIVLGKYFAALTVLGIPCAITGIYPLIYSFFGDMNFRVVYASLICFFLLGAALIAVCMFISSLTENQIIAAIISFVVLFLVNYASNLTNLSSNSPLVSVIMLAVAIILICIVTVLITGNKILAELIGVVLMIAAIAVAVFKSEWIESFTTAFFNKLALFDAFVDVVYGSFSIGVVVLYLSVAFLFNFFTVQALEKRRWA